MWRTIIPLIRVGDHHGPGAQHELGAVLVSRSGRPPLTVGKAPAGPFGAAVHGRVADSRYAGVVAQPAVGGRLGPDVGTRDALANALVHAVAQRQAFEVLRKDEGHHGDALGVRGGTVSGGHVDDAYADRQKLTVGRNRNHARAVRILDDRDGIGRTRGCRRNVARAGRAKTPADIGLLRPARRHVLQSQDQTPALEADDLHRKAGNVRARGRRACVSRGAQRGRARPVELEVEA